MDETPEPYFEWVPDDLDVKSPEDIMEYALRRVEAEWHRDGWDQPFALGVIFHSNMAELGAAAMSICVVGPPSAVTEDPESNLIPFAKLIAQAVYAEQYKDDDFQRALMQAAVGIPDQDLEAPRSWLKRVLERGGIPLGWFSIVEGFDFSNDPPENPDDLTEDQIRALPGVKEVRALTYLSADKYQMFVRRVRGEDDVEVIRHETVQEAMGFALGLLTAASLRMRIMMESKAGD